MSRVLVLNAGSSTVKFGLYTRETEPQELARGLVETLEGETVLRLRDGSGKPLAEDHLKPREADHHKAAVSAILSAS